MDNTESLILSASLSRTLSDQVTNQLRQTILDGRLKPGQRIVENEIAQAMEMSRGPVRDALRILESERLIVRYPRRGTFVAWLTLRDAEEIYSLRGSLETLAIEYAIKSATDKQIDELDQVVDQMAVTLKQDYTRFEATDLDLQFHHVLCRISGHSRVLGSWTALRAQVRLLILTHRSLQPLDFRRTGVEWHRQLVQALRDRDLDRAVQALRKHLAASFESVAQAIRQANSSVRVEAEAPPDQLVNVGLDTRPS